MNDQHPSHQASPAATSGAPAYAPPATPPPVAAMTGQVALGNGETRRLASPGKRLGARLIDWVILCVGALIISALGFGGSAVLGSSGTDAGMGAAIGALFGTMLMVLFLAIAYEVTLTAIRGQTVGKMAVGIRVARADNGDVPGWGKSIIRWALPNLMCLIPIIGWVGGLLTYISLTWDDRRQGWHDKAGATVVID